MSNTSGGTWLLGTPNTQFANQPSNEAGSIDSVVSQSLLYPFVSSAKMPRSPPRPIKGTNQQENENAELRRKLSEIEKITSQLSEEIAKLKKENEELKKYNQMETSETPLTIYNESSVNIAQNIEFHTDEDELERDTQWILKKKNRPAKKRKAESSPEVGGNSRANVTDNTNPVLHQQKEQQPKVIPKVRAPPPINVVGVTEFANIQSIMKAVSNKEYKVVSLNNNVWKINTQDPDSYRALATKLNEEGKEWYTYEDKNNRGIKVMARGLHPTCLKEDIIEDLKSKGMQIEDAVNILKRERIETNDGIKINKRGLPLFMLTFNKTEKVENVFKINAILNMRVKIEPLKKNTKLIPQCKKCQGFNHTQKYCRRETRCVKCAGKHDSKDCKEIRSNPAKCINCKGHHPANYRGCEVAKELQRLRNKTRQIPQNSRNTTENKLNTIQVVPKPQVNVTTRKTYSQIMEQPPEAVKENPLEKIFRSIEAINARLAKQERGLEALYMRLDTTTNERNALSY